MHLLRQRQTANKSNIKQFNPEVVVQYHGNWDHNYKR